MHSYSTNTADFKYLDLGTHGDSRYFFSMYAKKWIIAEDDCEEKGGNFLLVPTPIEQQWNPDVKVPHIRANQIYNDQSQFPRWSKA